MKRQLIILLIFTLASITAQASEFKFNNKNLNSLGALVCLLNSEGLTLSESTHVYTHKTSVNKRKIGPKSNEEIIELHGTCNNLVNRETLKVEQLGDEFYIKIDRSEKLLGSGKLGIKDINISFKNKNIQKITITDPLLLTRLSRDLSNSTWAKTNQIFGFNQKKLSLRFARKIAATETGGILNFNSIKFFNVWSDQAFGCGLANEKLSEVECEKLKNI